MSNKPLSLKQIDEGSEVGMRTWYKKKVPKDKYIFEFSDTHA